MTMLNLGNSQSHYMSNSTERSVIRVLGSLKLGVVVLASLAIVLIAATIYESRTSTRQVQMLVYQSWWFIALLGLLGVNVFSAAIARYPWKRHQTGFVLTHLGIIILLVGSIIGLHWGIEGSVTLLEGGQPQEAYLLDYEVVKINEPAANRAATIPIRFQQQDPQKMMGQRLSTAPLPLNASLKAYHKHTQPVLIVTNGGSEFNPAARFTFSTRMSESAPPMEVTDWLVFGDLSRRALMMGPAAFRIDMVTSAEALKQKLAPPPKAATDGKGVLELTLNNKRISVPIQEHLKQPFKSPNDDVTVRILEYFADFRLDEKTRKPTSVSDEPNNPAIMFEAAIGNDQVAGFAFADYPDSTMFRRQSTNLNTQAVYRFERSGRGAAPNTFTVLIGPDNLLYYTSTSGRAAFQSGELKTGTPVALNWMANAKIVVSDFIARPKITQSYVPAEVDPQLGGTYPAVELQLAQGTQTQNVMVRWGEPTQVVLGTNTYELAYQYATQPLGFTIALKKFEAPKYEGTAMPAGFESHVRVVNPKTGDAQESRIWMNHPLTYNNYRISQASYEEGADGAPNRSVLQVVRDPGYPLKGLGSILITLGTALMFYYRPSVKPSVNSEPPSPPPSQRTAKREPKLTASAH
jgi:hypothetical protein